MKKPQNSEPAQNPATHPIKEAEIRIGGLLAGRIGQKTASELGEISGLLSDWMREQKFDCTGAAPADGRALLLEVLATARRLPQFLAKAIQNEAFKDCVLPLAADRALEQLEAALSKVGDL